MEGGEGLTEREIIVAALSLCGTLAGSMAAVLTGNRLVLYRIEQLEQKVERHNRVVERTIALEGRVTALEHELRGWEKGGER